jgi:hypothetical protein
MWLQAMMAGPRLGTFSVPNPRMRQSTVKMARTVYFANA